MALRLLLLLSLIAAVTGPVRGQDESSREKAIIRKLTSAFENSTLDLQYDYVQNIHDGRGYTFGFAGFCSGTFDGTKFLKEYQRLNPGNALAQYLPAFEKIDSGPHDDEGKSDDIKGLHGFKLAFQSCATDPAFRQAQENVADELYWKPSLALAIEIGAKHAITRGQLYDAFINHGEDDVRAMAAKVEKTLGGTPKSGVDEKKWLAEFLKVRLAILKADPTWAESVDRIAVYQKLLADDNLDLALPIKFDCYGDSYTIK